MIEKTSVSYCVSFLPGIVYACDQSCMRIKSNCRRKGSLPKKPICKADHKNYFLQAMLQFNK